MFEGLNGSRVWGNGPMCLEAGGGKLRYDILGIEMFSVIVGIITIVGFCITIWQLCRTHSAAVSAEEASKETAKKVNASFLLPDIAELIRHARTVQNDAFKGHYEAARLRIQDLKDGICKYEFVLKGDLRGYSKAIEKIEISMHSLEQCIQGGRTLNFSMFSSDIEDVITVLNGIQNIVKEQAV